MIGLRVVTAEATPRVLELRGRDVFPVVHAYGTNGIIVAVEVPLARAQPWVDVTACFPTLAEAATFALEAGNAPSVPCRGAAVYQAPLAFKFLDKEPSIMHAERARRIPITWRSCSARPPAWAPSDDSQKTTGARCRA